MKRLKILGLILISSLSLKASTNPLEKSDLFRRLSIDHQVTIKIVQNDSSDESEFTVYNQDTNSLAIQTKPEKSARRKILMKEADLWLFSPGIKKPIRIGLDQRLIGEVSNGDILRTRFAQDYSFKEIGKDSQEIKFELLKKADTATYAKIIYFLKPTDLRPIKAEFYTQSGKLLKIAEYSDYKKVGSQTLMTAVNIVDSITKKKSTIQFLNHKKAKFTDIFFNKESIVE